MHVEIYLEANNDAFSEAPRDEIARILRDAADKIELNPLSEQLILRDINGNNVGLLKAVS